MWTSYDVSATGNHKSCRCLIRLARTVHVRSRLVHLDRYSSSQFIYLIRGCRLSVCRSAFCLCRSWTCQTLLGGILSRTHANGLNEDHIHRCDWKYIFHVYTIADKQSAHLLSTTPHFSALQIFPHADSKYPRLDI